MDDALKELKKFETAQPSRIQTELDDIFARTRARTRGAIIDAHHVINSKVWTEADDKMLDMVTAWLDNLKAR